MVGFLFLSLQSSLNRFIKILGLPVTKCVSFRHACISYTYPILGLGGGFELGAEFTDFVIVMNSTAAVESFMKGSNVTLGGNLTVWFYLLSFTFFNISCFLRAQVAFGPHGRNMEADVSLRSAAAFYTYSKSRYLFYLNPPYFCVTF